MSLKKLDDDASKDFWDFVERSAEDWRQQQPAWSRELDQKEYRVGDERDCGSSVDDDTAGRR